MRLVSSAEMRALEAAADAAGRSYDDLMDAAGTAVAEAVWPWTAGGVVFVLCGPGHNGGDGLVAGARLAARGLEVRAIVWRRADDRRLADAAAAGVALRHVGDAPDALAAAWEAAGTGGQAGRARGLAAADAVVDALFGTGARLPLPDGPRALLDAVAAARAAGGRARLVAVDLPSGVDADTGAADPHALAVDETVTFGFAKPGHVLGDGAARTGRLVVAPIGLPGERTAAGAEDVGDAGPGGEAAARWAVATAPAAAAGLPPRPADGHKGTFGTVAVVAGSLPYAGAAALAAAAATRAGAGRVAVAAPRAVRAALAAHAPEATFTPLGEEFADAAAAPAARRALAAADAVLLGPGLSRTPAAAAFLDALLADPPPGPWVVDADALTLLADAAGACARVPAPAVLTPHPGEMARLTAAYDLEPQDAAAIGRDRLGAALALAARSGHLVVLKGAGTVVAAPDGRARVVAVATPALATAGTGDVLAGVIAALLAGGAAPWAAAVSGAWAHAAAGRVVADRIGTRGARARDLLDALPAVWRALDGRAPPS